MNSRILRLIAAIVASASICAAEETNLTWLSRRSPTTKDLLGVAYRDSEYVAVGAGGAVLISPDGTTWKTAASSTSRKLFGVAATADAIVAVGDDGAIEVSTDGRKWKHIQAQFAPGHDLASPLYAVINTNGRWFAVGDTGGVMVSDDAQVWFYWNLNVSLQAVAHNKTGLTVAIGKAGNIWWNQSPSLQWQAATNNLAGAHDFTSIAFGNGRFVAVSPDGTAATSKLGSSAWASQTSAELAGVTAVCFGEDRFVATKAAGGVLLSSDGETWVAGDAATAGSAVAHGDGCFVSVAAKGKIRQTSATLAAQSGAGDDNPNTMFGDDGAAPQQIGLPRHRVNTASLDLLLEGSVFHLRTVGPPIDGRLTFRHAAMSEPIGMFGRGWRLLYESSIEADGDAVTVVRGSGRRHAFTAAADLETATPALPVTCTPPEGVFDSLKCHGTHWLYVDKATRWTYRYDWPDHANPARLVSVTDRNGNAITITVNQTTGIISAITDGTGRIVQFQMTGARCTTITVPAPSGLSRVVTCQYTASEWLTGLNDLVGDHADYEYDSEGFLTAMQTAGRLVQFGYAARPGVEDGKILAFLTNARGSTSYELVEKTYGTIRITSPQGEQTEIKTRNGQTAGVVDPLGAVRTTGYVDKLPVSFTDAKGGTTHFDYDTRGNVTKQTDALGRETTFVYDGNDNLLSHTNALGQTWTYQYDANGNLTRATSPMGHATAMTYDAKGRVTQIEDANHRFTGFINDDFGNVTRVTDALGNQTNFEFDATGIHATRIVDARGKIKRLTFDRNDRLTRVDYLDQFSTLLGSVTNAFEALGQTSLTDELNHTTAVRRDDLGAIIRRTDPLGFSRTTDYDSRGLPTRTLDELRHGPTMRYDDAGRLTETLDALGHRIAREYDAEGNLTLLRDARKNLTTFKYNANNLLTETRDPLGRSVLRDRDELGRVTRITNARGEEIQFTYDADGREVAKQHVNAASAGSWARQYDAVGNLTGNLIGGGAYATYTYDARNNLTRITYADGKIVDFAYDAAGNLTTLIYPGGVAVAYGYDDFNRIRVPMTIRNGESAELRPNWEKAPRIKTMTWSGRSITSTYDAAARLTREVRSNGTTSDYGYDDNDRLVSIAHKQGATSFLTLTAAYDAAGNCVDENVAYPPAFDPGTPLPAAMRGGTYRADNQINTWDGVRHGYDRDGNLLGPADQRFTATHDAGNRLVSLTRGGVATTFTYDTRGDCVQKVEGSTTTNYHYDLDGRLLFETDGTGTVTTLYIYKGRRVVAAGTPAAGFRFYHADRVGSTLALTDNAGTLLGAYAYEPFGAPLAAAGSPAEPFGYVGGFGVRDEGGGLLLMKNRHYDTATAHFLQRDPLGHDGGVNLYAYAYNNPVKMIDPLGLKGWATGREISEQGEVTPIGGYPATTYNAAAIEEERQLIIATVENSQRDYPKLTWVADKVLGLTDVSGVTYGVIKTAYQLGIKRDPTMSAWEGVKTAAGRVGDAVDFLEDLVGMVPVHEYDPDAINYAPMELYHPETPVGYEY